MRRFVEALKTIILVFLGASMLALWTGYVYLQFDRTDAEKAQLERSFWIFNETEQTQSESILDTNYFSPVSVSLIFSSNAYSSGMNVELTDSLYTSCLPLINEIFSSSYVCQKTTPDNWNSALDAGDAIFIEYPSPLPYTTIALFAQKGEDYCDSEVCYVEKLIIYSDSSDTPIAISSDGNGNYHSFVRISDNSHSFIYDFNSNNLAAYTVNEGFVPFKFNKNPDNSRIFKNLPPEYKLLTAPLSLSSATLENPLNSSLDAILNNESGDYLTQLGDGVISELLDVFEINPNIAGYYADKDTGIVLVEKNHRLSILPKGEIIYSLISDAAPIITTASLLNSARVDFTSSELLTAATVFLNSLPKEIMGNEAELILEKINYSSKNDEMKFTFSYYYNLSEILLNSEKCTAELTFNSEGLIRAILPTVSVSEYDGVILLTDDTLTTDILPSIVANLTDSHSIKPVYSFTGFNESVAPLWATGGSVNEFE